MQESLRAALAQKTRLAALGAAVAKINHDLRGILATARLASDQLAGSADPKVRRIAPMLLGAIDRAVRLCSQTLAFVQEGIPAPRRGRIDLRLLVAEAGAGLAGIEFFNEVPRGFFLYADEEQIFRAVANLLRNAAEAGARIIAVRATPERGEAVIEIADDGPGLSERARATLFQPFAGSAKSGGSGLGLAIAQEILRAHGGDIELAASRPGDTVFRLRLPMRRQSRGKAAAE
jgi:signal transduction histidine kinase